MHDYNFAQFVEFYGFRIPLIGTLQSTDDVDILVIRWDDRTLPKIKAIKGLLGPKDYKQFIDELIKELEEERTEYFKQMKAGV